MTVSGEEYVREIELSISSASTPSRSLVINTIDFVLRREHMFRNRNYSWNTIPGILFYELSNAYAPEWRNVHGMLWKWISMDGLSGIGMDEERYNLIKRSISCDTLTEPFTDLAKKIIVGKPVHPESPTVYHFIMNSLNEILYNKKVNEPLIEEILRMRKIIPENPEKRTELIERSMSYFFGYPGFIKTCLYIVSDWIWWKNIVEHPDWYRIKLLNSLDYTSTSRFENSTGVLLGRTVYQTDLKQKNDVLYHWIVLENLLPVVIRIPARSNHSMASTLRKSHPGSVLLLSGEVEKSDPDILYGVRFFPIRINDIRRIEKQ